MEISIIVAAYNEEKLLGRCLTSLAEQDFSQSYEVIVVDDGSTDQTLTIAKQFEHEYPDVFKIIHQKNQGQGMARNVGLECAQGKYIGFTDADDWVEPNYLSELYNNLIKYQSDIAICDVHKIFVENATAQDVVTLPCGEGVIDIATYITTAQSNSYSWNKLYRREIWQHHSFKKMAYEDLDILIPLISHCKRLSYVPKALYNYYKHADSTTSSYTNPRLFGIFTAYQDLINNCATEYRIAAEYCALKRMIINMKTPGFRYYLSYFIELIQNLNLAANQLVKNSEFAADSLYYSQVSLLPNNFYLSNKIDLNNWQKYQNNEYFKIFINDQVTELIDQLDRYGGIAVFEPIKLQAPIGYLRAIGNFVVVDDSNKCIMLGIKPKHPLINFLRGSADKLKKINELIINNKNYAADLFDVHVVTVRALCDNVVFKI
ncbi:glycosyltransferase [Lactobacillus sp. ESL0785]|uniref:glycosyltransferase family 2 protein n=1 Tax=Lactobacillus sp. ESL0785 TaxID=2983232 RepID=UPI0023FA46DF|nr:glycosyltransferase [Lactobacillus sp. ESL0785]WEV71262.1 glycosyltransferase [Lactobacillus sp. ESL0785]